MNTGGDPYEPAYKVSCSECEHPPETGWAVHSHGQAPPPRVRWLADVPAAETASAGPSHLQGREGVPYELQLRGEYVSGVTGNTESTRQVLSGSIQPAHGSETKGAMPKVSWVARLGDSVQSRFEGNIIRQSDSGSGASGASAQSYSLSGKLYTSDAEVAVSGTLKRPGVRALHVGAELHPSNNGISLTRRRVSLLQSMSACFCNIGPLSSSDKQVRVSSDQLTVGALRLLTSEPSEDVQYWAARTLLTLLDTNGAVCLAAEQDDVKKLLAQALRGIESPCTQAQSTVIAVLISKLAAAASASSSANDEGSVTASELLGSLLALLYSELAHAVPSSQVSQCLRGLYNSCHNMVVRAAIREEEWSALFWKIADTPRCVVLRYFQLLREHRRARARAHSLPSLLTNEQPVLPT